MCCSGPMPLPGAVTQGLTCEWDSGRRERVGVCGGKGRFSPSLAPLDLALTSSIWLLWLLGNIFSEGKITPPDFEPAPSKPRRTLEIPCVNKVRLGRGWEEKLVAPVCGSCLRRPVPTAGGDLDPLTRGGEKLPEVLTGAAADRAAPGRVPPGPFAFPPFVWEGEPQPASTQGRSCSLPRPLAISLAGRRAPIFQRGQKGMLFFGQALGSAQLECFGFVFFPRNTFRVAAVAPWLAPAKFLCGDFAPHVMHASTCHAHQL